MFVLLLNRDKRILSATLSDFARAYPPESTVSVDVLPEGDITDYLYKDGEYIYDPIIVNKGGAEVKKEIRLLKSQLSESDYKAIKYAEGWISEEDYAPIKAERQALRDRINELEDSLQ